MRLEGAAKSNRDLTDRMAQKSVGLIGFNEEAEIADSRKKGSTPCHTESASG